MIGKGKSRGNGAQLAKYLLNDPKNVEAELMETRGFPPGSLADQLTDADQEATENTRGKSPFYFTALRLGRDESLTAEQWLEAIEIAEKHLGYVGLERAIVRHQLPGEGDHYHVVWNRHDHETGKLRSDSNNGRKLREAMNEIEDRFGLRQLGRDRTQGPEKAQRNDDEIRQDERSAKPKAERVEEITRLWNATDSGKAFRAALEEAGYTLARGKSRAYCVVDETGEIHSLARQIDGATTADVKARLADLDPASIPDADDIKAAMRQARKERGEGAAEDEKADRPTTAQRQAERQAEREADAAEIEATEAAYDDSDLPHVPTPRERSQAEREASAGIASTILNNLTWNRSTFTRADLEREAAKMTGHRGRESWMAQSGGFDELDDRHRASAERSYEKWAEENPHAAAKYGIEDYVSYTQRMEATRHEEKDPAALKERVERREAFKYVMEAIDASGELVKVGPDPRNINRDRYTTRSMLTAELEMEAAAATLADRGGHTVRAKTRDTARQHTEEAQDFDLSREQREALKHVTGDDDISIVVGYAGAGKSTMLNAGRAAFEAQGFRTQGTALSGIAARNLEDSAGIKSVNLDRLLHRLDGQEAREAAGAARIEKLEAKIGRIKGRSEKAQSYRNDLTKQITDIHDDLSRGKLSSRDVVFVDEAAMIGSRKMGRLLAYAVEAGAKVVLVGDHEQVQAIEAGAAFRALMDRHGAAVMKDVRRQGEEWQREATKDFAEGRARDAVNAYREHGMTHQAESRDDAKAATVTAWARAREDRPDASSIMLTHLNADVHDLNQLGRAAFRAEGRLGADHELKLKEGSITLAEGDRLLFRKNDGHLDVRNGSLGTVKKIGDGSITVALDTAQGKAGQGREVTFKLADYQDFSHGYAATVHKTQGATVDRAFVLATPGMDRHTTYVAMSRHRERADLFHAKEDFKDHDAMTARLSRSGAKDSVLDYLDRAGNGEGFASTLRAAVAGLWDKVASLFKRGENHPAEAAQQAREAQAKDERRPSERIADHMRDIAVQEAAEAARKAEAARRGAEPPKVDPAHAKERVRPETSKTPAADPQREDAARRPSDKAREDRAAEVARLREAEAKRRRDDPDGPGGRG